MKKKYLFFYLSILLLLLYGLSNCALQEKTTKLQGDYLGQIPPGDEPEVFAPGVISHGFHEHCLTISPDGNEMFFCTSSNDHNYYTVIYVRRKNNVWQKPEISPIFNSFIGPDSAMSPQFSRDGKKLFFSSRRPVLDRGDNNPNFDIYVVEKTQDSWSEPKNMGSPVNSEFHEFAPSISADGTLYFQYWEDHGSTSDIYISEYKNNKYQVPQKLEYGISGGSYDGGPFIANDEEYILFQSTRPGGFGDGDTNLYISFNEGNNFWGSPINLGESINSSGKPIHPMISPDGKYLFFATNSQKKPFEYEGSSYGELIQFFKSHLNGNGTLWWVDAKIIEELR